MTSQYIIHSHGTILGSAGHLDLAFFFSTKMHENVRICTKMYEYVRMTFFFKSTKQRQSLGCGGIVAQRRLLMGGVVLPLDTVALSGSCWAHFFFRA